MVARKKIPLDMRFSVFVNTNMVILLLSISYSLMVPEKFSFML